MKTRIWLILFAAILLASPLAAVHAQTGEDGEPPEILPGKRVITLAGEEPSDIYVEGPPWLMQAAQAAGDGPLPTEGDLAVGTGFFIDYLGSDQDDGYFPCDYFPAEARWSLEYAAKMWTTLLQPRVPVRILACWGESMPAGVLASSGPMYWQALSRKAAPFPYVYYPAALANTLQGSDLYPGDYDIGVTFSGSYADYYEYSIYGAGQANRFNFFTIALHELAHGLGFGGSLWRLDSGLVGRDPDARYPYIYDLFTTDAKGRLLYTYPGYPNASPMLTAATQDAVFFTGERARAANRGFPVALHSPPRFVNGSSYAHLHDNFGMSGSKNALMTWTISPGAKILDPGPVAINLLADIGWPTPPGLTITLDGNLTIPEDTPLDTTIGTVTAADAAGTRYTPILYYEGIDDPPDFEGRDRLYFYLYGNRVSTRRHLDFEYTPTLSFRIIALDGKGFASFRDFTVRLLDRNDPITLVYLSRYEVQRDWPAGYKVAQVSCNEQDAGDAVTYTLLTKIEEGYDSGLFPDSASFRIEDGWLVLEEPAEKLHDYLSIAVRADSTSGDTVSYPLYLKVLDHVWGSNYLPLVTLQDGNTIP